MFGEGPKTFNGTLKAPHGIQGGRGETRIKENDVDMNMNETWGEMEYILTNKESKNILLASFKDCLGICIYLLVELNILLHF